MEFFQWLGPVARVVETAIERETTPAGRTNLVGMFLVLVLVLVLAVTPIIEAVVKLVRPDVSLGVPFLQILLVYIGSMFLCVILVGLLHRSG